MTDNCKNNPNKIDYGPVFRLDELLEDIIEEYDEKRRGMYSLY